MSKFEHGANHDTGNGALVSHGRSIDYPTVIEVRFRSYCGREQSKTWYEIEGDPGRRKYSTPDKAASIAHSEKLMPDAVILAEMKRRNIK